MNNIENKVKLDEKILDFFKDNASIYENGREKYFYYPFILKGDNKDLQKNIVEIIKIEDLSQNIKDLLCP